MNQALALDQVKESLAANSSEIQAIDDEMIALKLSHKHMKFVTGILEGKTRRDAAIAAGYSERSADVIGSRLITQNKYGIGRYLELANVKNGLIHGIPVSWKRSTLVEIANTAKTPGDTYQPGSAVRAVSELAKLDGDYPESTTQGVNVQVNLKFDFDLTGTEQSIDIPKADIVEADK